MSIVGHEFTYFETIQNKVSLEHLMQSSIKNRCFLKIFNLNQKSSDFVDFDGVPPVNFLSLEPYITIPRCVFVKRVISEKILICGRVFIINDYFNVFESRLRIY